MEYKETNETEYYEKPIVREVEYTVNVPEIRTKTEYVETKRKVPYVVTKTITEMVPEVRTRRSYRTETETVTDIKTRAFTVMVPEVKTRTVYKTKYRDIPFTRTRLYWEDVPQERSKITYKMVPRKVARKRVHTYTVRIPYQVSIRVPVQRCRMVPKTITIPVETCCDCCVEDFPEVIECGQAYMKYGVMKAREAWNWVGSIR